MLIMGDVVGQRRHQDADFWFRVCAGDSRAFEDIYRAHADALFMFCLRRRGVFQDAEDVVARTFEELWKQRARVQCDQQRGLRPWLFTVARRECGRLSGQPHPMGQVTDFLVGPGVDVVVEDVLNEHAAAALLTALSHLDKDDRPLATYSFVEELSSGQIGKRLGVPASTIRSRLARIKNQLERELRQAGYGPGGDAHD
jgi:RNA polymerase sigma-70 factor (ECF subfamily)